jgi:serine/threonine protein kinase
LYEECKLLNVEIQTAMKEFESIKYTSKNKSAKHQLSLRIARYHSALYFFELLQSQNGESKRDIKIKNIFLAYQGVQKYSDFIYSKFKCTRGDFLDFKVGKFDITLFQNIDFEIRFTRGRLHVRQSGVRRVTDVYELIPFLIGELDSEGFALFFDGYSWSEDKVHFIYSENLDKYYADIIDILKEVATALEDLKNSLK